jgi:hypothetical protein
MVIYYALDSALDLLDLITSNRVDWDFIFYTRRSHTIAKTVSCWPRDVAIYGFYGAKSGATQGTFKVRGLGKTTASMAESFFGNSSTPLGNQVIKMAHGAPTATHVCVDRQREVLPRSMGEEQLVSRAQG